MPLYLVTQKRIPRSTLCTSSPKAVKSMGQVLGWLPKLDEVLDGEEDPKWSTVYSVLGWILRIAEESGEVDGDSRRWIGRERCRSSLSMFTPFRMYRYWEEGWLPKLDEGLEGRWMRISRRWIGRGRCEI